MIEKYQELLSQLRTTYTIEDIIEQMIIRKEG
jgi:hypothetical protein